MLRGRQPRVVEESQHARDLAPQPDRRQALPGVERRDVHGREIGEHVGSARVRVARVCRDETGQDAREVAVHFHAGVDELLARGRARGPLVNRVCVGVGPGAPKERLSEGSSQVPQVGRGLGEDARGGRDVRDGPRVAPADQPEAARGVREDARPVDAPVDDSPRVREVHGREQRRESGAQRRRRQIMDRRQRPRLLGTRQHEGGGAAGGLQHVRHVGDGGVPHVAKHLGLASTPLLALRHVHEHGVLSAPRHAQEFAVLPLEDARHGFEVAEEQIGPQHRRPPEPGDRGAMLGAHRGANQPVPQLVSST